MANFFFSDAEKKFGPPKTVGRPTEKKKFDFSKEKSKRTCILKHSVFAFMPWCSDRARNTRFWPMFEIGYRIRCLHLQIPSHHGQEKKSLFFSSKPRAIHAFTNIPFLYSCHGAHTRSGTPDSDQFLKSAIGTDVSTSENRPSPDRKKKIFFFE